MSKELYELRDMLMDELDKITSKGELTAGGLETVDKLTHSIKSIDTICAMQEAGEYSHDGMSYAGRRNAMRDSRGRYSRRSYGYSGDSHEDVIEKLHELMQMTDDPQSKQAIKKCIDQMDR